MNSKTPKVSEMESSKTLSQSMDGNKAENITSPSATTTDIPSFGWSQYAERVNGRFAMIGFTAILVIEIFSHSGFLNWAGFIP